ncbi:MAG: AMP-binding protein [Myxococcota bacterium]|nr:AMP-binding protein [Myxococcota bacterium]
MSALPFEGADPGALALDDGTRRRSFQELADRTNRWARMIREGLRLGPDDHAALLMDNRAEGVEGILGAIHAGVWMTPVNHHLRDEEVAYVLSDSGAKAVFVDEAHAPAARAAGCENVLVVGDELEAALASASDEPMPLDGPAGGNMIYTSGTTGRPKGVKRARPASLGKALEGQRAYARSIACDGSGPHLVTGPLHHAAPLMFAVYDLACGAPVIVMPRFDERECLRILAEREVHHTHLVPTMFVRLLERLPAEERAAFEAPALHTVLHGAAPISRKAKQRMIDWWGPILYEYWGGTEGGVTTFIDSAQWLERPGSVGRVVSHYEVFAVDEQKTRLPAGAEGDLFARHASVPDFFSYHGDPEKTAKAFLDPHTHTLGDIGCVDEDGYVYLSDRRSHMIISGGVNIYPVEIEQVLQEHPAVADVGVFGIPDDEWGEQVKAAVELLPGHTAGPELAEDLRRFAREHLAGYKVPRSVDFHASLPRTPAGKLQVRQLKAPYWEGRGRSI